MARRKKMTAAEKAAFLKRMKAARAKKGGAKKGGAKRGGAKKRGSLEARVTRLEHSGAAVQGVVLGMVNSIRAHNGAKRLARIPGYVSPLGKSAAAGARALPGRVRS